MEQNREYAYRWFTANGKGTQLDAAPPSSEIIEWCSVLFPIVTGLPALCCCLALGGIFAYMGPVAIFIAARIFSRRLEQGWTIRIPNFKPLVWAKGVADFDVVGRLVSYSPVYSQAG